MTTLYNTKVAQAMLYMHNHRDMDIGSRLAVPVPAVHLPLPCVLYDLYWLKMEHLFSAFGICSLQRKSWCILPDWNPPSPWASFKQWVDVNRILLDWLLLCNTLPISAERGSGERDWQLSLLKGWRHAFGQRCRPSPCVWRIAILNPFSISSAGFTSAQKVLWLETIK